MPRPSNHVTSSAMRATKGEITTVSAPLLVVAGQGEQLVAQGLASAGGLDAQRMLSGHGRLDDGRLEGPAALIPRFGAKVGKAEPLGQLAARIVAPRHRWHPWSAQAANYASHLRKLVPHSGRHDGVAARRR